MKKDLLGFKKGAILYKLFTLLLMLITGSMSVQAQSTALLEPIKTTISWEGVEPGKPTPEFIIQLIRDDSYFEEKTISAGVKGNDIEILWNNLAKSDGSNDYVYTIEKPHINGYEITITGDMVNGFNLVCRYDTSIPKNKYDKIVANKFWSFEDCPSGDCHDTPATSLQLLQNDVKYGDAKIIEANAKGNNLKVEWINLPKYNTDAKEFVYTVIEPTVPIGYTFKSVEGNVTEGFTLTNKYICCSPENQTKITATKKWEDVSDQTPEITLVLRRKDKSEFSKSQKIKKNAKGNDLTVVWEGNGIQKYNTSSEEIEYYVEEEKTPNGYVSNVVKDPATGIFNVTNKYDPSLPENKIAELKAMKVWKVKDKGYPTPAVKLQLKQNGNNYGEVKNIPANADADDLTVSWKDLPKYNTLGEKFIYELVEIDVPKGYQPVVSSDSSGDFIVENIYIEYPSPIKATVKGSKKLKGKELEAGEFEFELSTLGKAIPLSSVRNDANGDFTIEISDLDKPGIFKYAIKEKNLGVDEYTYDTKTYYVDVEVSLNTTKNELELQKVEVTNGPLVFNNTFIDVLHLDKISDLSSVCEGEEVDLADYVRLKNPRNYVFIEAYKKGDSNPLPSTKVKVEEKSTYILKAKNNNTGKYGNEVEINVSTITKAYFTSLPINNAKLEVNEIVELTAEFNAGANAYIEWFDDKGSRISGAIVTGNKSRISVVNTPEAEKGIRYYTARLTDACNNRITEEKVAVEFYLDPEFIILQKGNYLFSVNNNLRTNGGYNFVGYKWLIIPQAGDKPKPTIGKINAQNYTPDTKKRTSLDFSADYQVELTTADGRILRTPYFKAREDHYLKVEFKVYPNPAKVGEDITVSCNLTESEMEDAVINVYTLKGALQSLKVKGKETKFKLTKSGVYYIHFKSKVLDDSKMIIVK